MAKYDMENNIIATINIKTAAAMRNFHSKALNRDFPVIYFVDSFTDKPAAAPVKDWSFGDEPQRVAPPKPAQPQVAAKPIENAVDYTVAEIISNQKTLSGKAVRVRGKVTKFTGGIMRKNWIHMSDDSGDGDLIVITNSTVAAGQNIVIEGIVALDRDFGYGYFYELLVEDANVSVEN